MTKSVPGRTSGTRTQAVRSRRSAEPVATFRPIVAGIPISHPDRLIYPDLGISKIDLARYFEAIAEFVLPHVVGRPLTLVHCPEGTAGPCRYLKHAKQWGPNALRRVRIQEKTKVGEYLVADSVEAVVALVQMGIVEIHTWNSISDNLEQPNRIIWDLDPGPDVTWTHVVNAARLVRGVLEAVGLASWVKTTGGRGLHVVAPITPGRDWSACLAFARDIAAAIVRSDPKRYTTTFAKRGREAQILIDYLRNNRTNTSICAYSPRARPGAPVSMPVDWGQLNVEPERWTLNTVPPRLRRLRTDPWARYWKHSQRLTDASIKALRRL